LTHIDLATKNEDGYAPIHFAAQFGTVDALTKIIPLREFIDERCAWNRTALMYGSLKGDLNIVTLLIKYGADINAQGDFDKITALHLAAYEGQIEIVNYLLQHGANPKITDKYNRTPYDHAVTQKHTEVQSALIHYQEPQKIEHIGTSTQENE
jgi:ankyrin repeat protein